MIVYADSSALVKLAINEMESGSLTAYLVGAERVISSEVSEVEVVRAAAEEEGERGEELARRVLGEVSLVELTREVRLRASRAAPRALKSLDAIHLATALELAIEGVVFVGYDRRLQEAAAAAGLEIQSPGA
ncbi:MAG TPA: PIN domain-containing protein [Acidimicrobiales bacterium]|nr:PIN domain-containing protein [Acidimicrobiales bacterium]